MVQIAVESDQSHSLETTMGFRNIVGRVRRRLRTTSRTTIVMLFCLAGLVYYLTTTHGIEIHRGRDYGVRVSDSVGPARATPPSPVDTQRQSNSSAVRSMAKFAWQGYMMACGKQPGCNELAPATNSCSKESNGLVGPNNLLTVVDSLDTLLLMDLTQEFEQGRDLVKRLFSPRKTPDDVSMFEATIRLLGGLLGAYSLSEDPLLAQLALQVGEGLSTFFADGSFPRRVKLRDDSLLEEGQQKTRPPGSELPSTNPAEVGSLYLEFAYLAEVTGERKFFDMVERVQQALLNVSNLDGLYPLALEVKSPWKLVAGSQSYTAGANTDSFYEYLVKRCLFDAPAKPDCIAVFTKSLDGIMKHLTMQVGDNHTCVTRLDIGSEKTCSMEHLTCYVGGMFALAYQQNKTRTDWLRFAENVTETCYLSYLHSPTKLGPEIFTFDDKSKKLVATNDKYILRPETVESIYYLYQVTGKQMYRDWGWNIVLALNSTTRTGSGFSGVNGMTGIPTFDDVQWSFYLAETLKYLYLLFSPANHLSPDQWIFTTEAHIIPTGRNPIRKKLAKSKGFSRRPFVV